MSKHSLKQSYSWRAEAIAMGALAAGLLMALGFFGWLMS